MSDNNPEVFCFPKLHFSTPSELHLDYPAYLHNGVLEQDIVENFMVQTLPDKDLSAALITNDFLFQSLGFCLTITALMMEMHQDKKLSHP